MKLILLGAAGSGKGTLARRIMQEFKIPQISTGDLLREISKTNNALGRKVADFQKKGLLVPDEITFEVLLERLKKDDCIGGYILDGFPRSLKQAQMLERVVDIDAVIKLDLSFEKLKERLMSRRQCANCGEIDNTRQFGFTGKCRVCGGELFQRDDDKPEAIKIRLEAYKNNIAPLVSFYGDKVHEFSSSGTPDEVYALVKTFLDKLEEKN